MASGQLAGRTWPYALVVVLAWAGLAAAQSCVTDLAAMPEAPAGGLQVQGNAQVDTFYPGLFDGGPAPTGPKGACSDPFAPPPTSQVPFWLGSATAAYQVEGAVHEGGRGPSIWDTFSALPGKVHNGDSGAIADDFYNRYLEDIQLMRALGIRHFRLSLAWPRLFPNGTGQLNQDGVRWYNTLIDALVHNCIEPHVTLYHWDLPQALQDAYGGWLNGQIVTDFVAYAEAAFQLFGDRVKIWSTINEPKTICETGFAMGIMAPGRCANRSRCAEGDSYKEPQQCAYHILLAHASAVSVFRSLVPDGKISFNANGAFFVPLTDKVEDVNATETLNRLTWGQYLDPLFTGDWSAERLQLLGPEVLPRFSAEQTQLLKAGKPDYLFINYYGGQYGYHDPSSSQLGASSTTTNAQGQALPTAQSPWLTVFPASFRALLGWVWVRYNHTPIIVTENGVSVPGENDMPIEQALCDTFRIDYYREYIGNASMAVQEDRVDVQGYFAWSLLDNFEWADGFSVRFGINYVDYLTQRRFMKASALFLANLFGTSDAKSPEQAVTKVKAQVTGSGPAVE